MPALTVSRCVMTSPGGLQSCGAESIFSIDVKDWYHIPDAHNGPLRWEWDTLPPLVDRHFLRLLDIFSEQDVRVTCFFLGWVAERFPHLVREALKRGHEIASHGYNHRVSLEMTRSEFLADALHSRRVLEDLSGCAVRGYRSISFSALQRTPWFFDTLLEAQYEYDSSVFPGLGTSQESVVRVRKPHRIMCQSGMITEFPITVANVCRTPLCFFGGGYLRFFPTWLILHMARSVAAAGLPVFYYVRPREIDPGHPRLPMSLQKRFKCYVNLDTTEKKIARITRAFSFVTFSQFLDRYRDSLSYRRDSGQRQQHKRMEPMLLNSRPL